MTNHISQTPQQLTRSSGSSVKLENKALLEEDSNKSTTGFSNLLAERKSVGKKLEKTTNEERQETDVKVARDQVRDQNGEQPSVTSDEKNEQLLFDQQAPQKIKLISLFEMVASGEKPLADNRNQPVAAAKNDQPPAEHLAKSIQVEKNLSEDVLIEGRLASKTLVGNGAVIASVIKKGQTPLNKEENTVPEERRNAKTATSDLQGHQQKGAWKYKSADRGVVIDQPVMAKEVRQKKTFPTESPQRLRESSLSSEKQVNVASLADAETVEVVENTKVTNFPANIEEHAWKQISQKLVPSLIDSDIIQNNASAEKATTPQPVFTTVSKTVKYLKIQLKPENLGTVQVNLTMGNGSLEVVLSTSDRHLAGRLVEHSDHLTRQLKEVGITSENISVKIDETDMTSATRTATGSKNGDAAYSFNEQKQSQANNRSFAQTKEQQPDVPNQKCDNHVQNEENFQPINHGVNARGNRLL